MDKKRLLLMHICFVLLLFHGSLNLLAKIPDDIKKKLDEQIQQELEARLKEYVNEKEFAELFQFEYPVEPPTKSLAEIQKEVDNYLDSEARKKYPESWVAEQMEKEAHRFVQWEEGDQVTVKLKDGQTISGWLRAIDPVIIQINMRKIHRADLDEESILHLDPGKAAIARNNLEIRYQKQLQALREQFKRENRLDATRNIYRRYGYIMIRGKWIAKLEYFQQRIHEERERIRKMIEPALTYQVYYKAGYREFKGEWYPPEEAIKLRALAKIEEELKPQEIMQLMDQLNEEGFAGVSPTTIKKLFGEDTEKQGSSKTVEDPIDEKAKAIKENIKTKKELLQEF